MTPSDPIENDVLDVEAYARSGKEKPRSRRYRIRIDRNHHEIDDATPTGAQILALAGKSAESHLLAQQISGGGPVTIRPDQTVDLLAKGVERFMTLPREATEGRAPRRQFKLSEEDVEFLDARGAPWEAIIDGAVQWVLLHRFALPPGYSALQVTAAIRISGGYPDASLDMIYFEPALERTDGKPISSVLPVAIDGRTYQEWSRHRSPDNPWRVGEDNIATHCAYALGFLSDEIKKR
jgi:hypothetical protein